MTDHTTISKMAKVPDVVTQPLQSGTPIADLKLEAHRVFGGKMNSVRGQPKGTDLVGFRPRVHERNSAECFYRVQL